MAGKRWARLRVDLDLPMRRGAWYRVRELSPLEAVIEINHTTLPVPSAFLVLADVPPRRWAVVPRPERAIRIPDSWARYGVCPSCRERVQLTRKPSAMQCPRCNSIFEVGWDEPFDPGH